MLISLFCGYESFAGTTEYSIPLEGHHKFKPGDDLKWASPDFDDSKWQTIKVPGDWQAQGIKSKKGMGWYRIHFFAPKPLEELELGISLGTIGNADETYLNGVKIGGEGVVGRRFVEATHIERLYKLPRNLMWFDQDNVLAVRVINTYWYGGIFRGKVTVGAYPRLQIENLKHNFGRKAEEIVFISILCLILFSCLLVYVAGMRELEYIYFGITVALTLASYFLDGLIFYETGLRTSLVQQLISFLFCLFTISIFFFVMHFLRYPFNRMVRFTLIYFFILSIATLLYANLSHGTYTFFIYAWIVGAIILSAYGGYYAVRAILDKRHESIPMALCVILLIFSALAETINTIGPIRFQVFSVGDYLLILFAMSIMYALAQRFIRFRNRSKTLSARILTAHEEERKRLARELHDGLGQNLLAVHFNLKRVG